VAAGQEHGFSETLGGKRLKCRLLFHTLAAIFGGTPCATVRFCGIELSAFGQL